MAEMKLVLVDKYISWVEFSQMRYNAPTWVLISIGISVCVAILSYIASLALIRDITLLPIAFTLAALVLTLGYPYMRKQAIIDSIEKNFSDSLKQMADTLKAGDTYESALREVANSEYGRLSDEMNIALRRLEEGENLETALTGFAQRVDSKLIRRTITIVLDSIRTGSSLSEILEEIADDVRDLQRLKEERKSNTTMQFIFMVAAGGVIAPLIFGEITAVMGAFASINSSALDANQLEVAKAATDITNLLIQSYIVIEVLGSGIMMSLIREGKFNKSVIYIPILLVLAFVSYYGMAAIVKIMLAGAV